MLIAPFAAGRSVAMLFPLALGVALLVDRWRTPDPQRLGLERRVARIVGLGQRFERELILAPLAPAGLALELHEQRPASFALDVEVEAEERDGAPEHARTSSAPQSLRRAFVPSRRGAHALGSVRVSLRGPLGLIERHAELAGEQHVSVRPALANLARSLRLASDERLRSQTPRRARRRGGRTEFESLRDWVPGDDARTVDWKATARRARPTVREHVEERGQELLLLVDVGRRMRALMTTGEQRGWTRLDHALDAALELAAVALAQGERVGLALFAEELVRHVAPARGQAQLERFLEVVEDVEPRACEADLGGALRALAQRQRRRALVVVLSDFADPLHLPAQRAALASSMRRQRVVFAALDDPGLTSLASSGPAAQRAAALELEGEAERARRELAKSGARVLSSLPSEGAGRLLTAWLEERRR